MTFAKSRLQDGWQQYAGSFSTRTAHGTEWVAAQAKEYPAGTVPR